MEIYKKLERIVQKAFGPYELTELGVEALGVLLDNRFEGLILVDPEGRVVYMNHENERYLGLKRGEARGRHITEFLPTSRLHEVCKTGKAEVGQVQEIKGRWKVANRIPIVKGGKVLGAMGSLMFRDVKEVSLLARRVRVLEDRVADYEKRLRATPHRQRYTFDNILGKSPAMRRTLALAEQLAASDADVLISGETGTGKELFAHAIHNQSPRGDGPFVRLNCASIPRELAESELFGYEPGSFSGARKEGQVGKFEQAHGGTIFLDEIGDLPLEIQGKLLRVLQEREVERIGGNAVRFVNFRLIAASNLNLKELTERGKFRLDLFFRLNKLLLPLPPLRERPEDIPLYVRNFLDAGFGYEGERPREISPDAMEALMRHPWPGNVRELLNVVERAAWNTRHPVIGVEDLPAGFAPEAARPAAPQGPLSLREALDEAERRALARALDEAGGNRSRAARLLGIHRTTLYEKLERHGWGEEEKV